MRNPGGGAAKIHHTPDVTENTTIMPNRNLRTQRLLPRTFYLSPATGFRSQQCAYGALF